MAQEELRSFDTLSEVLSEAQKEFGALASQDLVSLGEAERELYFARYSLLKQLIISIQNLLDESNRLRRLESQLLKVIQ